MSKVIIIGGGLAGLTAGIYAQKAEYETEIFEKNPVPGGECTGWDRQGYHIDNCIHWLTGSRKTDGIYQLWREIGALEEETRLYKEPYFYMLDMNGKQLHLWRDLEKAREELLAEAPEDHVEINKFFDAVKFAESMQVPCEKSPAHMNLFEYMKLGMSMKDMAKVLKEYGSETVEEFAARFMNPMVRELLGGYFNRYFMAYTLITSYAFYTSDSGAIPEGGSRAMALRIAERYRQLGGKLHLGTAVKQIDIVNGKAQGIVLADDTEIVADAVICATDTSVVYEKLLDQKYMDKNLKKMYDCREGYSVTSTFHTAFGIVGEQDCSVPEGATLFPCEPFTVGTKRQKMLGVRLYDYDKTVFPKEKRVLQCNILQDETDYEYWKALYGDREVYKKKKQEVAEQVQVRIIEKYPQLAGRLVLLDVYSPMTYERWCGAYKGAYMSFYAKKGYNGLYAKNTIEGLSNVFLASQWLQTGGGLPMAATSGKFAVQALQKAVSV